MDSFMVYLENFLLKQLANIVETYLFWTLKYQESDRPGLTIGKCKVLSCGEEDLINVDMSSKFRSQYELCLWKITSPSLTKTHRVNVCHEMRVDPCNFPK